MKRILFLILNLGQGGAEKVLVNLVNKLDRTKYEVTVEVLFGGGVNEQFLREDVKLIRCFPRIIRGNRLLMKLFSPGTLHKWIVKGNYDLEIAFLEGSSTRIIGGCQSRDTKLLAWVHSNKTKISQLLSCYRGRGELIRIYKRFRSVIFVSEDIRTSFCNVLKDEVVDTKVLYNPIDSEMILRAANEKCNLTLPKDTINMISIGSLKQVKGYDRLLRIVKKLVQENYRLHLTILGTGPLEMQIRDYIKQNGMDMIVSLEGYQTNPYKYLIMHDLFVCSSYSEGYSTAVTEALVLGLPVLTTDVSGMRELLGENSCGCIVENSEDGLYEKLKYLLDHPDILGLMKQQAAIRGGQFNIGSSVRRVEEYLDTLWQ